MSEPRSHAKRAIRRLWQLLGHLSLGQWVIALMLSSGVAGGVATATRVATSGPWPVYAGAGSLAFVVTGLVLLRRLERSHSAATPPMTDPLEIPPTSAERLERFRQELQGIKRIAAEEMGDFEIVRPSIVAGGTIQAGGTIAAAGDIRAGAPHATGQSAHRPWLAGDSITSAVRIDVVGDVVTGSLRVQNVGNDIAIVDDQRSHIFGWNQDREMRAFVNLTLPTPIIAAGASADVGFLMDIRRWPPLTTKTFLSPDSIDPNLAFEVCYANSEIGRSCWARFYVTQEVRQPGIWSLYKIEYRADPEAEPLQRVNVRALPTG